MGTSIKEKLSGIKENIFLSKHTTFKIGGPAKYFFLAKTKEDLIRALKTAKNLKMPFFILGGGSNLLVSDKGYGGLVIKIQNQKATLRGVRFASSKILKSEIWAEAGTGLNKVTETCITASLSGLEWAYGIPGTVGGAVYGNSGAFGFRTSDSIKKVEVLDSNTLKTKEFSKEECKFNNKGSIFKKRGNLVILSVTFKLKKGKEVGAKAKEFFNYRKKSHPLNFPSAGCIFKNLKSKIKNQKLLKKFPELKEFNKTKMIPTSYLIDKAGLKGKKIGGAKISEKHANFIINLGKAKASDVKKLINMEKIKVKKVFGVSLEEEVKFLGF